MIRRTRYNKLPDAINASITREFTTVPNQLLRDPNVSGKAKALLCLLLSNKEGWVTHQKEIKKRMKEGVNAIQTGLKELEQFGYLARIRYRHKKTKKWKGVFWAYTDIPFNFDIHSHIKTLNKMGYEITKKQKKLLIKNHDMENHDVGFPHMENQHLKRLSIKKTNSKTGYKENLELDREFEKWYKTYPKKVAKQAAKKAWIKIQKLPKKERPSLDTLLSAVKEQSKSKQWQDKKYIPHPSTWLNQQRWKDEVEIDFDANPELSDLDNSTHSNEQLSPDELIYMRKYEYEDDPFD